MSIEKPTFYELEGPSNSAHGDRPADGRLVSSLDNQTGKTLEGVDKAKQDPNYYAEIQASIQEIAKNEKSDRLADYPPPEQLLMALENGYMILGAPENSDKHIASITEGASGEALQA